MSAADVTGTQHATVHNGGTAGLGFLNPADRRTFECGRDDLTAVATVSPGSAIEVAPCSSSDEVTGPWVQYAAGQTFNLTPADGRRIARMVGIGGAGLMIRYSGPGLEILRNYDGTRGTAG
jgi:hypothetical protein